MIWGGKNFPTWSFSVTKGTTNNTFLHGDQSPIVLQAPNYSWANYSWAISGGGSLQQPTNQKNVTVLPSGCGGTTTCTIAAGGKTLSSSYQLVFNAEYPGNPATVNGSTSICTGNYSFALNYLPPGATTQWNVSSNLDKLSFTNSSVTVKGKTGVVGSGTILMSYLTSCGTTVSKSKTVWVGKPAIPTNINFTPATPCLNQWVIAQVSANNTVESGVHYNWRNTHTYIDQTPDGSEVQFLTLSGPLPYNTYVYVSGANTCGSSAEFSKYLSVQDCGGGGAAAAATVTPNPASSEIMISISETDSENMLANEDNSIEENDVSIGNAYGVIKFKGKMTGKNLNVDISGWQEGIYNVVIVNKNRSVSTKFVIGR